MSAILSAITLRGLLPSYATLLHNALVKMEPMVSDQQAFQCALVIVRTSIQEPHLIHDDRVELKHTASAAKTVAEGPSEDDTKVWISACGLSNSDQEKLLKITCLRQSRVEEPIDGQKSVRLL